METLQKGFFRSTWCCGASALQEEPRVDSLSLHAERNGTVPPRWTLVSVIGDSSSALGWTRFRKNHDVSQRNPREFIITFRLHPSSSALDSLPYLIVTVTGLRVGQLTNSPVHKLFYITKTINDPVISPFTSLCKTQRSK